MKPEDRTTGLHALVERAGAGWYMIVTVGDGGGTRVVPLEDGGEWVVGRQPDCAIAVDDVALSRRHAVIRRRGPAVVVEDLGSRNGTTVNGVAIHGSRRVVGGDTIGMGPVTAIVATASASRGRQLASTGELDERLDAEVERALRYRRPLGLAMLRFVGPADGFVAHATQLVRQLRRMDLVAEYGPDQLAVVLPETSREATEEVARRSAGAPGLVGTYGFATCPEDGSSAGALIEVARARLRGARGTVSQGAAPSDRLAAVAPELIVVDPMMKQVYKLAGRAAASGIAVLVVGESGTGKERVAEAIHRLSARAKGPLVKINCAALPEGLVESELFGHEAGAFTGAVGARIGQFEAAANGTMFLDEVDELSPAIQVKLLRVLESRRITRVGSTAEIPIDVRLVCATNRDLETEVQRGRFREDLFYRIAAFVIPVPPLRDRPTEILPLAIQFAYEIATELHQPHVGFTPDALDILRAGGWPGNVRELRNVIERAVVLSAGERIESQHLPEQLVARSRDHGESPDIRRKVANLERDMLKAALDAAGGNQTEAAAQLGISRFALIRLLAKHDLKR